MLLRKFSFVFLIGCCCCFTHAGHADTIVHGDYEGINLYFDNVNESADEDVFPLFGAPVVQGNSLLFNNPGFAAAVGENAVDFIDGRLGVEISSKNNQNIYGFELSEFGDYLNSGDDLDIFVSGIAFAVADGTLYNADFQHWNNMAGNGTWSGNLVVRFPEPVTSFNFVLDNQLFARAGAGSSAAIDKNQIKLTVQVPEPVSTAFLLGTATLVGLCLGRRRRDS